MFRPGAEALALGERYRLALRHRMRGGSTGERLGAGTGSSIEFQDRRAYQPGDDVRHVDWRALARTDQLLVRQYREEVLPRLDLLIDASRSMRVEAEKAQLTVDLAGVLTGAARGEGFNVACVVLDDRPRRLDVARLSEEGVAFEGRRFVSESLREAAAFLRPGSLRLVLSDYLDPSGPDPILRVAGRAAGGWGLLQILGRVDHEPPQGVARRLVDVERDEALEVELDAPTCARYRRRLERLVSALRSASQARGGLHIELVADRALEEQCRERLLPTGLLLPA